MVFVFHFFVFSFCPSQHRIATPGIVHNRTAYLVAVIVEIPSLVVHLCPAKERISPYGPVVAYGFPVCQDTRRLPTYGRAAIAAIIFPVLDSAFGVVGRCLWIIVIRH